MSDRVSTRRNVKYLNIILVTYKDICYISQGKVCIRANVAHQAGAYPGFRNMKRLGVFLLPPGWDASPSQGYPPALSSPVPIYIYIYISQEERLFLNHLFLPLAMTAKVNFLC